jgi:CheY-like chemotaxis protein
MPSGRGIKLRPGKKKMTIPTSPAASEKPVVLVVEDDPMVRMFSVCLAEDAGFAAIAATNADEALGILEAQNRIQVVFTGIEMRGAMDGIRLAALVSLRWPTIGLLITSSELAVMDRDLPERSLFLCRPYLVHQVAASLKSLLVSSPDVRLASDRL